MKNLLKKSTGVKILSIFIASFLCFTSYSNENNHINNSDKFEILKDELWTSGIESEFSSINSGAYSMPDLPSVAESKSTNENKKQDPIPEELIVGLSYFNNFESKQ